MEIKEKKDNVVRITAIIGSLVVFLFLAYLIHTEKTLWFDQLFLAFSAEYVTGITYVFFSLLTNLGTKAIVISIAVLTVVIMWWKTRDYLGMITIVIVLIGSDQLFKVLKNVFQRERPLNDPIIDAIGYSFPSGHATVSMAFYGMIIYFILKYMKLSSKKTLTIRFFCVYILLMGLSRVFLQAHYLSDVLAGFSIGFVYLLFCIFIYETIQNTITKRFIKKGEITM